MAMHGINYLTDTYMLYLWHCYKFWKSMPLCKRWYPAADLLVPVQSKVNFNNTLDLEDKMA